jgi:hypothetical protein
VKDRYRRMRTLNNIASQRCRFNRRIKFQTMEQKLFGMMERNSELKKEVRDLETKVAAWKTACIRHLVPNINID